jgi:signal transduction histidine kinase
MGAELTVTEAPDGLSASFDRQRVRQLLGNLIDNALRHGENGPVELGAAASEAGVRIWVRDHGPGLSEEASASASSPRPRTPTRRGSRLCAGGSGCSTA